ncbi:sensor histidine kinase [Hyalangium sp.]|uniref:sensor histidine kinase n=1 Tax=Hyalangium sp. TaxID=2028555 RepID=UPI002D6FB632|nr:ATP-binding protein [Hyalangium sp.]HYH96076.1 ATP-binding protein [Hyalangium sp.]
MTAPANVNPEQARHDLHLLRKVGALLIFLALFLQFWGQWTVAGSLAAMFPVLVLINTVLIDWLAKRLGRARAETARLILNLLLWSLMGLLTQWSLLVWLFIPFHMLWFYDLGGWERTQAIAFLAIANAVALGTGCEPLFPLAFTLLGSISFMVSEKRTALFQAMLGQVNQQRELLQQAHERALVQEKLSSLGMMAAGIAHEINNPMSFVTSNVNSLHQELQKQSDLPAHLREYVEDVLPATLDGIRRVNSIVSDLRQFSRSGPEQSTEYDVNVEVKAALRLAQGQLYHCQVEAELGDVGMLMGRPRQIAQVLVNLLVNAGQATEAGGKVRVTTSREGEGVRVDIRDTGVGMSPETMRQIFQPFFTTKPVGVGTGLGLAVAHGIVTAHGGRITVESQLQQGSCFSVHLPLRRR